MRPHRGLHRRFLDKRQGLDVWTDFFPIGGTPTAASQSATSSAAEQTAGDPFGPGGILGGLSSFFDHVTSSSPSSTPSATSSTPPTRSSSSADSTTPSVSSPSSTSSASTAAISSTPSPTSSAADVIYTTSDGTRFVYATSTLPAPSATAAPSRSFLHNPPLEGGVFTLVGIAVLAIIFTLVTCTMRKRRRDRLERDLATAVTFDPGATDLYERLENSAEKRRISGSSLSHGYAFGHAQGHAFGASQLPYASQQEYHGPQGYGQYPMPAYRPPSPNSFSYQAPSYSAPQPAGQGEANLTRKFSDRKPVPPLSLHPGHDPANTNVTFPLQVYQQ